MEKLKKRKISSFLKSLSSALWNGFSYKSIHCVYNHCLYKYSVMFLMPSINKHEHSSTDRLEFIDILATTLNTFKSCRIQRRKSFVD